VTDTNGSIGLLFSGQGSQKAGMGGAWQHVEAWSLVARMSEVSGHDVADLLLHADEETLRRTDRAQLATFALEMVLHEHFTTNDARHADVVATAGHSLGEYAALVASGILELDAGTALVAARGAAMLTAAESQPGTMIAVLGAATADVEAALAPLAAEGAQVWIANLNAPDQTVVAGDAAGIEQATAAMHGAGKVVALSVGGAFHSPFMAAAADGLRVALDATEFALGSVPVVANVDATAHTGGPDWRDLLARQLTAPVRWTESVRTLVDTCGCAAFIELGPGNTLSGLVKRISRATPSSRLDTPDPRPAAGR
jgi:[acyl-carrier-protein] S-malonyltransferase